MNSADFESPASPNRTQETANASSTVAAAAPPPSLSPTNCEPVATQLSPVSNNIVNNFPELRTSDNTPNQESMDVLAPVKANDIDPSNTSKKVPMVMVPVTDSHSHMAITAPMSHSKNFQIEPQEDIEQAKDLLSWNDDGSIGTLEGCDLRFRVNQLGCLELLDSEDESENQTKNKAPKSRYQNAISPSSQQINNIGDNHKKSGDNAKAPTGVCKSTTNTNARSSPTNTTTSNGLSTLKQNISTTNDRLPKRIKIDPEPAPIKQISPGSSLLRDGPNIRRPKSNSNLSLTGRGQSNSLSLLKKLEQNQNSLIVEKLVSKQRLHEMKPNVLHWHIQDVKEFVDSIPGCSGYGKLFESHQICGKSLMHLDQRDLLDIINVKLGPAVKIYHAISLLK